MNTHTMVRLTVFAFGLGSTGCVADALPVPVDPQLTFAAHEVHSGMVIDRTTGGGTGMVTPMGGFHLETPLRLRTDGSADDELRITSPGQVVVERMTDAAEIGRVDPSWDNNALRLTLKPVNEPPLRSGLFRRTDDGAGSSVLTRLDQDRLDLEGTYRATLRAPDGSSVGWIALIVNENQPGHVMYEAVLPREIGDGLAAGTAEALASEISYIEGIGHVISRKSEER